MIQFAPPSSAGMAMMSAMRRAWRLAHSDALLFGNFLPAPLLPPTRSSAPQLVYQHSRTLASKPVSLVFGCRPVAACPHTCSGV